MFVKSVCAECPRWPSASHARSTCNITKWFIYIFQKDINTIFIWHVLVTTWTVKICLPLSTIKNVNRGRRVWWWLLVQMCDRIHTGDTTGNTSCPPLLTHPFPCLVVKRASNVDCSSHVLHSKCSTDVAICNLISNAWGWKGKTQSEQQFMVSHPCVHDTFTVINFSMFLNDFIFKIYMNLLYKS